MLVGKDKTNLKLNLQMLMNEKDIQGKHKRQKS